MIDLYQNNFRTVYSDTSTDKGIISAHMYRKFDVAINKTTDIVGKKNLVYFSVFKGKAYIDLMEMCIKSIVKFTPNLNFHILFITQQNFVDTIRNLECLSGLTYDFCIMREPRNGIEASIQKTEIFNYEKINDYGKILFLDCDIVCLKPLSDIFDINVDPKYLQVAQRPEILHKKISPNTLNHGLDFTTKRQGDILKEITPTPFNAGQFFFCNTAQMRAHFEIVSWLIKVWPGRYFFEQSFMNFYFMMHGLCKLDVLQDKTVFRLVIGNANGNSGFFRQTETTVEANVSGLTESKGKKIYKVKKTYRVNKVNHPMTNQEYLDSLDFSSAHIVHFIGLTLCGNAKLNEAKRILEAKKICL